MTEMPVSPSSLEPPEQPKKSNTWIWIVAAVVLLCCCCVGAIGGWWLWNNGDQLLQGTGVFLQLLA